MRYLRRSSGLHWCSLIVFFVASFVSIDRTNGQNLFGFPMWGGTGMMDGYGMGGMPYGGYGSSYGMGPNLGMGPFGRRGMTAGSNQYPYIDPQVYWLLADASKPASGTLFVTTLLICVHILIF